MRSVSYNIDLLTSNIDEIRTFQRIDKCLFVKIVAISGLILAVSVVLRITISHTHTKFFVHTNPVFPHQFTMITNIILHYIIIFHDSTAHSCLHFLSLKLGHVTSRHNTIYLSCLLQSLIISYQRRIQLLFLWGQRLLIFILILSRL